MPRFKVLIVDDEPLARDWLRGLLEAHPDFDVVGEGSSGVDAVEKSAALQPDVLFLDVQMPELDGPGALEAMGTERPRNVVFVTAYDRFALKAFELHALDYLLKPFDAERLEKTLDRIRRQRPAGSNPDPDLPGKLEALLVSLQPQRKAADRIAVKDGSRVTFVRIADLDWVEAYGNYVKLHVGAATHLLTQTMNGMEQRLPPDQFLRVHRSTIVNIDRIAAVEPMFHGEYAVRLHDGTELTLTRTYRERLQSLIDRFS
ncbi:MAG: response regulator transcription factor [Bryobacterales bacterium]|nr:response regulator transcription factor [Bryobacterales bacterium]